MGLCATLLPMQQPLFMSTNSFSPGTIRHSSLPLITKASAAENFRKADLKDEWLAPRHCTLLTAQRPAYSAYIHIYIQVQYTPARQSCAALASRDSTPPSPQMLPCSHGRCTPSASHFLNGWGLGSERQPIPLNEPLSPKRSTTNQSMRQCAPMSVRSSCAVSLDASDSDGSGPLHGWAAGQCR